MDSDFREKLRVAIIGDPHFHREGDSCRTAISHIRLDGAGEFISRQGQQNPWTGLVNLVSERNIRADVLICAGDMTYGADRIGLRKAWDELGNLAEQLCARFMVSATGNHDVCSRSMAEKVGRNPTREMSAAYGLFEPLKLLSPSYPIVELQDGVPLDHRLLRTKYFGDSLVLVETDKYRIVVLNSCCEHGSDAFQHERGSFPKSALAALSAELKEAHAEKINILVCHHPPEPHSVHDLGAHDFIENGEALLQCLEEHGTWFVIHGHKHHGRIAYAKGTSSAPIVFSAASLGIQIDSSLDGMRNQFYCIDIFQKTTGSLFGKVDAWDWNMGLGWRSATRSSGGIYDGCGFGARVEIGELADEVAKLVPCLWTDAVGTIPALEFLSPGDMSVLEKRLSTKHQVVVQADTNGYWSELLPKL
jgi:3',5'-cyclic AMP phosphodiesterase CpdA